MANRMLVILFLVTSIILGCTRVPKGLEPVSGFDGQRYLGRWYEIARLDHSFERNLSNVSAMYTAQEDGMISVVNLGYNEKTGEWKQIEGRARFIDDESAGSLKVSFFGPFYGGYHVIALDKENYSYAMVSGPDRFYLWILSRTTSLDEAIFSDLKNRAAEWGFDTTKLVTVKHDRLQDAQNLKGKTQLDSKAAERITPCPKTPNCVSSLVKDQSHYIEPIPYKGSFVEAQNNLLEILNSSKGARLVTLEENYIHAEFVSSIFRFVDDVEFYFDDHKQVIHIKSASRTGYSDLGVNRRRMENIRKRFNVLQTREH